MERRSVNLLYRLAQDHLYRLGNMNDLIVEVARATRIRHNILRAAPRAHDHAPDLAHDLRPGRDGERVGDEVRAVVDEDDLRARMLQDVRNLTMGEARVDCANHCTCTENAMVRLWKAQRMNTMSW